MMSKIRFEPAGFETEINVGKCLIDLTDEHPDAEVPYSCRSASCGTCRVQVLEGMEALAPMQEDEREVLEIFGDGPDIRLCCQLRVQSVTDLIRLSVVDP